MPETSADAQVEHDYRARLNDRRATFNRLERRHLLFSRVRLGMVALGFLLIFTVRLDAIPYVAVLAGLFVAVAAAHARVLGERDRARRAVAWYERGIERLEHRWVGRGDPGDRFKPDGHPYADDLDLFGRGSLFEMLATPRTPGGQEMLAAWLLTAAPPVTVCERQPAVQELARRTDLRESLGIVGEAATVRGSALRTWAIARVRLDSRVLPLLLALVSAANITLLIAYFWTGQFGAWSLGMMAVQAAIALAVRPNVVAVTHDIDTTARDFAALSGALRVLEPEALTSSSLKRLSQSIAATGRPASAEIARIERLSDRLAWRMNIMFALPAALMLWTTQCACAIDRWRHRVGPRVPGWLDAVAEFEALSALATFAAEHPAGGYPTFGPEPAHMAATALAHPLLGRDAVANDVAIGDGHPSLLVVSGSNMSGKSTFLRAIGVNVVLAHAGAPVRAATFRLSPISLGASIRVLDSLQDGRSHFYAEITRLKQVVDLARSHPHCVLFLLDEVLSGTNSHDRAVGAGAIFDNLLAAGAIGLATTHDLALSELAKARAPRADNVHFADRYDAGGLAFDYRLRPGPVKTSNALELMRSIGLDV